MTANPRTVTRWVTPEGARLALVHLTYTSRHRDGWHLVVKSATGTLLLDVHFGATCTDDDLAPWLTAARAVPVLPTTTRRDHP